MSPTLVGARPQASLSWISLGGVDLGDRWGAAQCGYDEQLDDLVAELDEGMAQAGQRWTVLDPEIDQDAAFRTTFAYGPAKHALGSPTRSPSAGPRSTWTPGSPSTAPCRVAERGRLRRGS